MPRAHPFAPRSAGRPWRRWIRACLGRSWRAVSGRARACRAATGVARTQDPAPGRPGSARATVPGARTLVTPSPTAGRTSGAPVAASLATRPSFTPSPGPPRPPLMVPPPPLRRRVAAPVAVDGRPTSSGSAATTRSSSGLLTPASNASGGHAPMLSGFAQAASSPPALASPEPSGWTATSSSQAALPSPSSSAPAASSRPTSPTSVASFVATPLSGHPSFRPAAAVCYLPRSQEVIEVERALEHALLVIVAGSRAGLSREEVAAAICSQCDLAADDFTIHKHAPEDFLLCFSSLEHHARVAMCRVRTPLKVLVID